MNGILWVKSGGPVLAECDWPALKPVPFVHSAVCVWPFLRRKKRSNCFNAFFHFNKFSRQIRLGLNAVWVSQASVYDASDFIVRSSSVRMCTCVQLEQLCDTRSPKATHRKKVYIKVSLIKCALCYKNRYPLKQPLLLRLII